MVENPAALPVRARTALHAALRHYPGAIGELVARELASWGDFGHRLGSHALVARLVDHLDGLDELDAGGTEPRRPARHVHPVPGATDTTASIARLGYAEIRTVLYAALHARRAAYPGPVGEVVARELAGYIDIGQCLSGQNLFRTQLRPRWADTLSGRRDRSCAPIRRRDAHAPPCSEQRREVAGRPVGRCSARRAPPRRSGRRGLE